MTMDPGLSTNTQGSFSKIYFCAILSLPLCVNSLHFMELLAKIMRLSFKSQPQTPPFPVAGGGFMACAGKNSIAS